MTSTKNSRRWVVETTSAAATDIANLKKAGKEIGEEAVRHLLSLEEGPFKELGGLSGDHFKGVNKLDWTHKGISYRAAVIPQHDMYVILVFVVGTRENFYKLAERRVKRLRKTNPEWFA